MRPIAGYLSPRPKLRQPIPRAPLNELRHHAVGGVQPALARDGFRQIERAEQMIGAPLLVQLEPLQVAAHPGWDRWRGALWQVSNVYVRLQQIEAGNRFTRSKDTQRGPRS